MIWKDLEMLIRKLHSIHIMVLEVVANIYQTQHELAQDVKDRDYLYPYFQQEVSD